MPVEGSRTRQARSNTANAATQQTRSNTANAQQRSNVTNAEQRSNATNAANAQQRSNTANTANASHPRDFFETAGGPPPHGRPKHCAWTKSTKAQNHKAQQNSSTTLTFVSQGIPLVVPPLRPPLTLGASVVVLRPPLTLGASVVVQDGLRKKSQIEQETKRKI